MNIDTDKIKRTLLSDAPEDKAIVLSWISEIIFVGTLVFGWLSTETTDSNMGYYFMLTISFMLSLTSMILRAMVYIEKRNKR